MSTVVATRGKGLDLAQVSPLPPSPGASEDARVIARFLREIVSRQASPSVVPDSAVRARQHASATTAERLYTALADAKVLTSKVAMHLSADWRARLFAQLDDLMNIQDWHDDDQPVLRTSFATFLRMIINQNPERRPGLGVSHQGNLIAAWSDSADRLTIEFLPNDLARWVLSCEIDGERERAAGETPIARLPEVLRPYKPERWFSDGRKAAA